MGIINANKNQRQTENVLEVEQMTWIGLCGEELVHTARTCGNIFHRKFLLGRA